MSDHSTDAEGSDGPPDIDGMRVQRAVGELLEYDSSLQAEQVYGVLQTIATRTEADEGPQATVTREAAEEELERLSTVLTAAKTRVESAEEELEAALEAAGEERERGVVQHRLDGFAARLDTVQREVNQVGGRLRELTAEDEGLFAVARGIVGLEHQANDLQGRAGDLQLDLEEFGTWVSNARTRFDELDGDLNALSESLERTDEGVDHLETAVEAGDTDALAVDDPALAWVDATFTHEVLELLLSDLEWEFDALRAWSDEDGDDVAERVAELATRLGAFDDRVATLGERLDSLRQDEWAERFADERGAFERDLADVSPPVDWGLVQATLTEHRQGLQAE